MTLGRLLVAVLLSTPLAACTKSGPAELLETAKFEELQTNVPHARELYERIVEQYPESPEAVTARSRLEAIGESDAVP